MTDIFQPVQKYFRYKGKQDKRLNIQYFYLFMSFSA